MRTLLISFAVSVFASAALAAHPFLCCDYGGGKVCAVSAEGKIEWQWDCKAPQDCWKLPNGNYLFCYMNGALEVTADKKVVWEYKQELTVRNRVSQKKKDGTTVEKEVDEKVECHACQPLPNGHVMIVECGTSRIIEVDRAGKIAKEIKLKTAPEIRLHNQFLDQPLLREEPERVVDGGTRGFGGVALDLFQQLLCCYVYRLTEQ